MCQLKLLPAVLSCYSHLLIEPTKDSTPPIPSGPASVNLCPAWSSYAIAQIKRCFFPLLSTTFWQQIKLVETNRHPLVCWGRKTTWVLFNRQHLFYSNLDLGSWCLFVSSYFWILCISSFCRDLSFLIFILPIPKSEYITRVSYTSNFREDFYLLVWTLESREIGMFSLFSNYFNKRNQEPFLQSSSSWPPRES